MGKYLIGFSTGCFYKFGFQKPNEMVNKSIEMGVESFELQYHATCHPNCKYLQELDTDLLSAIPNITIHLTSQHLYSDDEETEKLMKLQSDAYSRFNAKASVIHPIQIINDKYIREHASHINLQIENMDNRMSNYRFPDELMPYDDLPRILDIQHVYSNDPQINKLEEYIPTAGLTEVHISGYNPHGELHFPLYKTKQDIILDKLKTLDVEIPLIVIIESVFMNYEEARLELEYIREKLN